MSYSQVLTSNHSRICRWECSFRRPFPEDCHALLTFKVGLRHSFKFHEVESRLVIVNSDAHQLGHIRWSHKVISTNDNTLFNLFPCRTDQLKWFCSLKWSSSNISNRQYSGAASLKHFYNSTKQVATSFTSSLRCLLVHSSHHHTISAASRSSLITTYF